MAGSWLTKCSITRSAQLLYQPVYCGLWCDWSLCLSVTQEEAAKPTNVSSQRLSPKWCFLDCKYITFSSLSLLIFTTLSMWLPLIIHKLIVLLCYCIEKVAKRNFYIFKCEPMLLSIHYRSTLLNNCTSDRSKGFKAAQTFSRSCKFQFVVLQNDIKFLYEPFSPCLWSPVDPWGGNPSIHKMHPL